MEIDKKLIIEIKKASEESMKAIARLRGSLSNIPKDILYEPVGVCYYCGEPLRNATICNYCHKRY